MGKADWTDNIEAWMVLCEFRMDVIFVHRNGCH
jgi:hypothetical protein